jgi:hypothetical protein
MDMTPQSRNQQGRLRDKREEYQKELQNKDEEARPCRKGPEMSGPR